MKDYYILRVIRDLAYTGAFVYIVYYIVEIMAQDRDFSIGEMFFTLFLLIGLVFLIAEIEDEKKPRRFTVKVDGHEYQADDYSLNIMKNGSYILMNGDEYVSISKIDTLEIIRNPGHPDKKGHTIDISQILKDAEEFARSCQECKTASTDPSQESPKKRTAPNKGKTMSPEQKKKISEALKKRNAEKKAQNARIAKTHQEKQKRDLRKSVK